MKKKQMKASLLLASLLTLGFSVTGCTNDDYDFDQIDRVSSSMFSFLIMF